MHTPMHVVTTEINSGWEVAERLGPHQDLFMPQGGEKLWIPAEVPGHVHSDLLRAGIISDPFYRMQERACQWVDEADWTYRKTITVSAERLASRGEHGRHFLHFHGLDTICRVFLNGIKIGEAENFFVPHRFDVTEILKEGDNELRVEFDSALRVGRERAKAYLGDGTSERGSMSYFNFGPRAFVRKSQYMFGWDWGPELISCGLWQKVELVTVPVAEIVDWKYEYTIHDNRVNVVVTTEIECYAPEPEMVLGATLSHITGHNIDSESFSQISLPAGIGRHSVSISLSEDEVSLWPHGFDIEGYNLVLKLFCDEESEEESPVVPTNYDQRDTLIGFRKIELIREPDADGKGESFKFRLNGVDTFIKGANWIPDHSFPASITKERLRERLQQAKDAGFNMLRIWGGGYYETEDFYDLCDELGILVWQDFPFACSMYPDDLPEFNEEVRKEAIAAVKRIRNHPSLALWCGGNENLELAQGRWAGPTQAKRFFGDTTIHQILPEVLAEHDPNTPYWPNSPYGDAGEGNSQNEDYGDSHYWNVWHSKKPGSNGDWVNYAESTSRFSSEFGFGAPAGLTAWNSCMAPEDKTIRSLVSQWHDKTRKGFETYIGFITRHYPTPQTFEDFVYYGQCNQADALKFGVEHYRRMKGRCWGTLFWQINDCWPTHSWAVIDSIGEPKAAYYAAKRFYAPVLVSLVREGDTVHAHVINDLLQTFQGASVTLRLLTFRGEELAFERQNLIVPENSATGIVISLPITTRPDALVHAVLKDAQGKELAENFLLLTEPKDLTLPHSGIRWQIKLNQTYYTPYSKSEVFAVDISAKHYAGYVWLYFEGMEKQPTLTDNFFHLAPEQTRTILLSNLPEGTTQAELEARLRVRHL